MALKPLKEGEKNRILRNIGLMFQAKNIELLDKYGYNFLYLASGFIAHYDRGGFIHAYGSTQALAQDILSNQSSNQWGNFRKGENGYEYYMQKKEIYNCICEYAQGKFKNIPAEKDVYKAPSIKSMIEEEPEWRKSIENAYRNHLKYGNYFNASEPQRVIDLADITMAYDKKVVNGIGADAMKDNEFLLMEFTFDSGNTGTPDSLLNCYRNEIWEIFNHLSGRAFELGIEDPLAVEDEDGE